MTLLKYSPLPLRHLCDGYEWQTHAALQSPKTSNARPYGVISPFKLLDPFKGSWSSCSKGRRQWSEWSVGKGKSRKSKERMRSGIMSFQSAN